MATADLLTVVIEIHLRPVINYYLPRNFLNITPLCRVIEVLRFTATYCSVWFTVAFTFDRFVAICCQKLKTKYCTEKTAAVVLTTTGVLSFLKNVPRFFLWEPRELIDNVPWFCKLKGNTFTDPGWVVYDWLDIVLNPFIPFVTILLFNALTVKYILVASRVREGLRGQSRSGNRSDPEMASRRRSAVYLFTLSGSFILLWMTLVVNFLYYEIKGIGFNFNDSEVIFHLVGALLKYCSCCTNTFIYAVTQSKFREQMISAGNAHSACCDSSLIKLRRRHNPDSLPDPGCYSRADCPTDRQLRDIRNSDDVEHKVRRRGDQEVWSQWKM